MTARRAVPLIPMPVRGPAGLPGALPVGVDRTRPVSPDAVGWAHFRLANDGTCDCGHLEWQHKGLDEPACTHLGSCPCPAFSARLKATA